MMSTKIILNAGARMTYDAVASRTSAGDIYDISRLSPLVVAGREGCDISSALKNFLVLKLEARILHAMRGVGVCRHFQYDKYKKSTFSMMPGVMGDKAGL